MLNFIARLFRRDPVSSTRRATQKRNRTPRPRLLVFEPLEGRMLLSVSLPGIPDWIEQGPAPTVDGQASASPDDAVSGAVEALAAHPTNADILYAGGAGGIWRTTNSTSATPNWTPLTDQYPTLAISDLAFSPLDATNFTLFAGTGAFNSGGPGGPALGGLRSTDGGNTWIVIGSEFSGQRVRALVPTSIGTSLADQVVLAATVDGGGVWRSANGGTTFTLISGTSGTTDLLDNDADGSTDEAGELNLPTGNAGHLVGDPGNINRFYTALPGQGIFRSDNGGANWVNVSATFTLAGDGADNNGDLVIDDANESASGSTRIELSVSAAAGNPVYAALIGAVNNGTNVRSRLMAVFRSTDLGITWTPIGTAPAIHPGGQAGTHFSILADRADANVVFIGGDRQGGAPFVGNLFRGDASGGGSWTDLTDVVLPSLLTAPHADSRDMVFDANGDIVESDDGGVFRLDNPTGVVSLWSSLNRNLGVGELYGTPYDHVSNVIFAGTQDTGSIRQSGAGSLTWDEVNQGDGGFAAVGYFDFLGSEVSVEYTMGNNFGTFVRHFSDGLVELALGGQLDLTGLDAADNGFTGFSVFPYETNVFSGARFVLGGTSNLYETTDFGDNLTIITPAGFTGVTALAYGGSLGGVANPDVVYAGIGGSLFLRTSSGGAFTQLTTYTGGSPSDIALDPDNWNGVYVTDGASVFHSIDGGANWVTINSAGLATLTSGLASVEVFSPTTAVGDEVLLVGGLGGVFRTRNPSAGATALWTEYGIGLPNSPVADVQYDATDDVLVVSAYGRGAWKVEDASLTLPVAGVLQINGDTDFAGEDDVIKLIRNSILPNMLDVFLNNLATPVVSVPIGAVEQINVNGLGGNDQLRVDSSFGLINVVNGIRYDGGDLSDSLQLLQTGGPSRPTDTYTVGPANGQGLSFITGGGAFGNQSVRFENLEPVLDLVPAALLTVNATAGNNAINYGVGSALTNGLVSVDAHETIDFSNKTALVINALAGTDSINVNNAAPTGLTSIAVNGGDPAAGDVLTISGAGVAMSVNTGTSAIAGAVAGVGVNYSGIESLVLGANIAALTLNTTGAADALVVTPGASGAANSGTLNSSGALPSISFVNSGALTANLAGGSDSVTVNGTSGADIIAVGGAAVGITGRNAVNYTGAESVIVNGGAGSDTFNVTPTGLVAFFVDGGDPVGTLPGDLLAIFAGGDPVTYNAGPETDEGSFDVGANAPVSFDHIESFAINGSGPAVINGTNGPDSITVVARDSSFNAAADGVRDFTVSVNTGPQLLFIDVLSLTVNALNGSDEVALVAPAPNGAVWDVNVAVNGGEPAAAGDRLVVNTPAFGAESASYTPNAADGGTLDLSSLSSPVVITGIETLSYDGQNDGDTLTVLGGGGADTIVHTPGANDQSGTIAVNALLAIAYQNLGALGLLRADGAAGANSLVLLGTALNDSFSVNAAPARINLNTRLTVESANNETLTLEGGAGDDLFTLVPALSASPFTTINFNGGTQASAAGDRMVLVGGAGADNFTISGQSVLLGGKTVNGNGVENIKLDALGGANSITYNGVVGVTENVTISSSGITGAGQISVPGVTLVDFSNVQTFDVNGNLPVPTETDTLAFSGTNGVDLFTINLAANGTTEPVLRLGALAAPLLTLRSYTNFNTLRVNGLDGADTFNVYTSDAGPLPGRNVLIDGGAPTAKKKSTDNLNVYYTPSRPRIIQSAATQNPGSGLVDLAYTNRRFLVQYVDMEQIVIAKGGIPV